MSWQLFKHYSRVIALAFEMALKQNFTDLFIMFAIVVQPLIIATLALWMLKDRGEIDPIYIVIGSAMTGLWSSLLFISGNSITRERWTGTLECLVGSPTPLPVVVFGRSLANVVQSLLSMVVCYALVSIIFGYPLVIKQPLLFIASLLLTVISFVSFGLIVAALFVVNPDVQRWQNGLEFPIYILSGFLFPIAILPLWTTPFSYLLTPYWAARALHSTSAGTANPAEITLTWGMMIIFSLLYFLVSKIMFTRLLFKARVEATLGMQ